MSLTLKDMSTRELITALRAVRLSSSSIYSYERNDAAFVGKRLVKGGEAQAVYATAAELQAELETRPHVPNKQEAKAARIARKKQGK